MLRYRPTLIAVILLAGCGCDTVKSKTSVSSVEKDIRENLPIGSSKAEVTAYLDARKIPHSWLRQGEIAPDGNVVIPDSHTEQGIVRDVRKEGFIFKIFVSIQMDFKFDDSDSKLVNYSVREVYKGP